MKKQFDKKLWFAKVDESYQGNEPCFWDIKQYKWTAIIEDNYFKLMEELEPILHQKLNVYDDNGLQYPPKSWSKFVFYVWGLKNHKASKQFPVTSSLLKRIPNLSSCFVSLMDANSKLKAHCGDTNANIRYHLGLIIPSVNSFECGMQVGNEVTNWEEGKGFMFLDAHYHNTWNLTQHKRYILIIDVIRDEFSNKKRWINARVLTNLVIYPLFEKLGIKTQKIPKFIINFFAFIATPIIAGISYLQSKVDILKIR